MHMVADKIDIWPSIEYELCYLTKPTVSGMA